MFGMATDLAEHERHLEALREAKHPNPHDAALLTRDRPDLRLNHPATLVHEAWCEYEATKRFWDSDQPPDLWDIELRQDVRAYARQMEYFIAQARQQLRQEIKAVD